jgi:hypothetical protein
LFGLERVDDRVREYAPAVLWNVVFSFPIVLSIVVYLVVVVEIELNVLVGSILTADCDVTLLGTFLWARLVLRKKRDECE